MNNEILLMVTGHRPHKIPGGYNEGSPGWLAIRHWLGEQIQAHAPRAVISGMALGVDTVFAVAALELGVPLVAAIPFQGQEAQWPAASKARYQRLLARAAIVHAVSPPGYHVSKMHVRNQWMVDTCTHALAVWDGSSGGTGACVRAIRVAEKPLRVFDPRAIAGLLSTTIEESP